MTNKPDRQALMAAREALDAMLRHSCVADSAAEDKDAEDHDAERAARSALALIDAALAEAAPAAGKRKPAQAEIDLVKKAISEHSSPGGIGKGDIHGGQRSFIVYEHYIGYIAASIVNGLAAPTGTRTQVGELIERLTAYLAVLEKGDRDTLAVVAKQANELAKLRKELAVANSRVEAARSLLDPVVNLPGAPDAAWLVNAREWMDGLWRHLAGSAQLEARPTTASGEWKPTHQHYKGGYYRVMARGRIEADLSPVVIYDNEAGETWVRPVDDFDQRDPFVRFAALAVPQSPASPEPEKDTP